MVVYQSSGAVLATPGVTLGYASSTVGTWGISSNDPRTILVESTSGLGWLSRVWLVSPTLRRQALTALSAVDGYVSFAEPLMFDCPGGSSLESADAYCELSATDTAVPEQHLKARFTATMPDGQTETADVMFDIVPHILRQPITPETLTSDDPMLSVLLPDQLRGTDWTELLSRSWESVVRDIAIQGYRPSLIMDESALRDLHLYKFKTRLCESGFKVGLEEYPGQWAKYFAGRYDKLLHDTGQSIQEYDGDEDGKADADGVPKRSRFLL